MTPNGMIKSPAHFLANFDLAAHGLIKAIPNLVINPSPANFQVLEDAITYLRVLRDAFAMQHGLDAQTSLDSMALIRQDLVNAHGEEAIAKAEVTGKVPASIVADAMLEELFGSDNA